MTTSELPSAARRGNSELPSKVYAHKKYEVSYRNTSAVFFNRFYRPKVIFRTSIAIVSTVLAILRCSCISALTCCAVASD